MKLSTEYAAAFLDGEGCISITCSYHKNGRLFTQLKVSVVNTNEQIIQDFCAEMNARMTTYQHPTKNHKRTFRATWQGKHAIAFLTNIRPFLRIKGRQADLAFKFWAYMQQGKAERCERIPGSVRSTRRTAEHIAKEHDFHLAMKTLNKRGRVA